MADQIDTNSDDDRGDRIPSKPDVSNICACPLIFILLERFSLYCKLFAVLSVCQLLSACHLKCLTFTSGHEKSRTHWGLMQFTISHWMKIGFDHQYYMIKVIFCPLISIVTAIFKQKVWPILNYFLLWYCHHKTHDL